MFKNGLRMFYLTTHISVHGLTSNIGLESPNMDPKGNLHIDSKIEFVSHYSMNKKIILVDWEIINY